MRCLRRLVVLALAAASTADAMKVLVTGAGGKTGKLVFEQLKADKMTPASSTASVDVVGLCRSKKAVKTLKKVGAEDSEIIVGDITNEDDLATAMEGVGAVVMCTSAVPQIKKWSIVKLLFKKKILRRKDAGRPSFKFIPNGTPEEVDWLGARNQIDAAKKAGVGHFIFVSSMGGTDSDNFLNTIGRQTDGSGGDILLWKRRAERYLIASGLSYTIVHPGGLVDEEAGKRELVVDVDDKLMATSTSRTVPRADLARVCIAALFEEKAKNSAFDLASKAPDAEGSVVTDDASDVFKFLKGKTCSYESVSGARVPPSIPALR